MLTWACHQRCRRALRLLLRHMGHICGNQSTLAYHSAFVCPILQCNLPSAVRAVVTRPLFLHTSFMSSPQGQKLHPASRTLHGCHVGWTAPAPFGMYACARNPEAFKKWPNRQALPAESPLQRLSTAVMRCPHQHSIQTNPCTVQRPLSRGSLLSKQINDDEQRAGCDDTR